jgi:hypothetical protein
MYPQGFTQLFSVIAKGNCQSTIPDIAGRLELPADLGVLGQITKIQEVFNLHSLRCVPALDRGEIETVRVIMFQSHQDDYREALFQDLAAEESGKLEFKTSLVLDVRRYMSSPEPREGEACRSDAVLYSALKTVAAFANGEGGRLYIGITDEKIIDGLKWDFATRAASCPDRWELFFRDSIQGKFKDGLIINDYIEVSLFEVESVVVARIDVTPRPTLSFLKKDGKYFLFRRQGNRTTEVDISEMEEFLSVRWQLDS